ncbi:hypothetical protein [Wolbachia endosymbiont of Mansonella perstans]|uniref:hypothetical protein n=1 Tax=Wolbachia endosymbiont of Mansonella perstans TaxID=229526 RepID=UPI001CE22AE5|nr:hypothetical protein [Wolbachia endosymbiont of Mansonella perstans]MCA4774503.1 hypothetical protein [Wolbachia endosymbiont of Mansonella perstans]
MPNSAELEKLIKNEISDNLARRFKYFGDNEFAYCAFFMIVLGWMKDREGRFLSTRRRRIFRKSIALG